MWLQRLESPVQLWWQDDRPGRPNDRELPSAQETGVPIGVGGEASAKCAQGTRSRAGAQEEALGSIELIRPSRSLPPGFAILEPERVVGGGSHTLDRMSSEACADTDRERVGMGPNPHDTIAGSEGI